MLRTLRIPIGEYSVNVPRYGPADSVKGWSAIIHPDMADPYQILTRPCCCWRRHRHGVLVEASRGARLAFDRHVATLDSLFIGLLILDLIRLYAADVRPETFDYRWGLYLAAIMLLETSAVVLWVYGDHAAADHAKEYRWAVVIGILGSFVAFVGVALQPLFA